MADFVSHHVFGAQALQSFPVTALHAARQYPVCFRWGCQGPDPLFFRSIALGSPLHKLGNRMHSEKTDELFFALSRAVQCLTGQAHLIASAYFYGFLCHYALDSEIHPYVYCRQEQLRAADPQLNASAVHCQIESDIDYLLHEQTYGETPTHFEPDSYYRLQPTEKAILAAVLHAVLRRVYHADVPLGELRGSFDDMLAWQRFLFSNHPALYRSAQRIEQIAGRGAILTAHMKQARPTWDCLNEGHEPWRNLWHPGEVRTDSVAELFDQAQVRACALAGRYAALFASGRLLCGGLDLPFDNGNPKRLIMPED